ncbi:hypothetical protein BN1097_540030 [Clostridioides difficile]|uniref:Uncharacterized protein n=1 Tax=Clostridioides difficile TaxID=1496 RepID=A0A069ABC2_CLODI|nr:hypothetical protein BN1097_540030 [Clostridioides difficile]
MDSNSETKLKLINNMELINNIKINKQYEILKLQAENSLLFFCKYGK